MDTPLMFAVLVLIAALGMAAYQATLLAGALAAAALHPDFLRTPHDAHLLPPHAPWPRSPPPRFAARAQAARWTRSPSPAGASRSPRSRRCWSRRTRASTGRSGIDAAPTCRAPAAATRSATSWAARPTSPSPIPAPSSPRWTRARSCAPSTTSIRRTSSTWCRCRAAASRKPADLKGKRIGVYSLSSGTRQNLQVLLHQAGLTEADVTVVVTGLLNFAPLMQGQVDATAATDTGLLVGRRRGLRRRQRDGGGRVAQRLERPVRRARGRSTRRRRGVLQRFLRGLPRRRRLDDRAAARRPRSWRSSAPSTARDPALNLEIIRLRNAASVSALTRRHGPGRDRRGVAAAGGRRLPQAGPGRASRSTWPGGAASDLLPGAQGRAGMNFAGQVVLVTGAEPRHRRGHRAGLRRRAGDGRRQLPAQRRGGGRRWWRTAGAPAATPSRCRPT